MEKYIQQIANAESLSRLNDIVETAAFDDNLSSMDYCKVHKVALEKAQSWLPKPLKSI